MKKIYTIDNYAYSSRLRVLNPQYKAIVAVAALLFCIVMNKIEVSLLIFLTMGAITTQAGGLSYGKYMALLKIPLSFLILGTLPIIIEISPVPYGFFNIPLVGHYLAFTRPGLWAAVKLLFKAMGALSALYMLVLSTPASEVICVFQSLHVPKLILELMNMIYRFIFVIMATQCSMKTAAQSRLGYCDFKTFCRTFGKIGANLFVISLKKAGTYYDAMTARCYDGELLFLEEEKSVKGWQIGLAVGYFLVLFLVWYWVR